MAVDFRPPWTPQQQLKFTGILNDPDEPHQTLEFYVFAGATAPTVTGGWAKIQTIDRARRKGLTMPTGYDPASMDVPIRFECVVNYGTFGFSPAQIERNIQILEWMAGRGKLYANGTHPATGTPPLVQISSFASGSSVSTNLIPPNYHSDTANDLRWLISNIQYDTDPIRGPGGDRHRQDATVSVIEYVAAPGAPTSPRKRQKGRGTTSGFRSYRATQAQDTIAKICHTHGLTKQSDWIAVVNFNVKRTRVRSYNHRLTPGQLIEIPTRLFTG